MCDFTKHFFLIYIGGVTLLQEEIGQKVCFQNPCFLTKILFNYFYQLEKQKLKKIFSYFEQAFSVTPLPLL